MPAYLAENAQNPRKLCLAVNDLVCEGNSFKVLRDLEQILANLLQLTANICGRGRSNYYNVLQNPLASGYRQKVLCKPSVLSPPAECAGATSYQTILQHWCK